MTEELVLYHGTASANVAPILASGLQPRHDAGNWNKSYQVPSMEGRVYLTSEVSQAHFHAIRTALIKQSDCAIVSVKVTPDNLYPDENLFKDTVIILKDDLKTMQAKAKAQKDAWTDSLKKTMMVAHEGPIASERLNINAFPVRDNLYYPFVQYTNLDLKSFDYAFDFYNRLLEQGWFRMVLAGRKVTDEEVMKNLKIIELDDNEWQASLFGHYKTIIYPENFIV